MINGLKVLAVIPARGGSKGLPGKNIKEICGKPLVAWSIEQAKESKYVDDIVVSTDSEEIAKVAKKYGAEVPFLRPIEISGDKSTVTEAVLHVIEELEKNKRHYDIIVSLEPTKPIRESNDIDLFIETLANDPKAKSIIGLIPIESPAHPDWAAELDEEGFIVGKRGDLFRRQNLTKRYCYTGIILGAKIPHLKIEKTFYTDRSKGFVIHQKEKTMDINDEVDFIATEAVLNSVLNSRNLTKTKSRNQTDSVFDLIDKIKNKKIVLFGAASSGKRVLINLIERGIKKEDVVFYDNNPEKWEKNILGVSVITLNEFKNLEKSIPILISSCMFNEITSQLKELGFTNFHYVRDLLYAQRLFLKYDDEFLKVLEDVRETCNMDSEEKFTLYSSMKALKNLDGDVAEVGVYKGGSAKVLCEAKGNKPLHLFDTFEGLPETKKEDLVKSGWLSDTSLESVKGYLKEYDNIFLYKGIFPETSFPIKNKKFCLVHLDTDIYQGTLDGLKFFWPKMVKGGRIISHDYNNVDCPGVKKAFKEFFAGKEHLIIDIADTQGMIIKNE